MPFDIKSLFQPRQKAAKREPVVIVSGLPRSGTSMMMKIIDAGGLPILTDHLRTADEDNPKGYYEFERVKKMPEGDFAWLPEAEGKCVKIISFLLQYLPSGYEYRVIFMRRAISEILASQAQMLLRRGEESKADDARMEETYQEHLKRIRVWLANQANIQVLYIDYNALMKSPKESIEKVHEFLGMPLDLPKMLDVPDASLYRQRKTD
jgi:hypothetical protein